MYHLKPRCTTRGRNIHVAKREKETRATEAPEEPEGGAWFLRLTTAEEPAWQLVFRFRHHELRGGSIGSSGSSTTTPPREPFNPSASIRSEGCVDLRQKPLAHAFAHVRPRRVRRP